MQEFAKSIGSVSKEALQKASSQISNFDERTGVLSAAKVTTLAVGSRLQSAMGKVIGLYVIPNALLLPPIITMPAMGKALSILLAALLLGLLIDNSRSWRKGAIKHPTLHLCCFSCFAAYLMGSSFPQRSPLPSVTPPPFPSV